MPNLLQAAGSHDNKDSGWAPIYTNRFMLGLATNRNPLRSPAGIISEIYYHLGTDAMWNGSNAEVSIRLTGIRRPGNPVFQPYSFASAPDTFYSFHQLNGNIELYADLGTQIWDFTPLEATITATALTGNVAVYTAANNFRIGQKVTVTGTTNGSGVFNVSAATIGFANSSIFEVALTHANVSSAPDSGTASAAGEFFAKSAGAGETYFTGVENTLYFADGVDLQKYTPTNTNVNPSNALGLSIWNWGGVGPTTQPQVSITEAGSANAVWVASTVFSTMGLLLVTAADNTKNIEYLTSVNGLGTAANPNTTQLGTTGSGAPAFNTTPIGSTTTDGTCTWTSWGPLSLWTANATYTNQQPIWDPGTGNIFQAGIAAGGTGITGSSPPVWNGAGQNQHANDTNPASGIKWQNVGPAALWKPNFTYHAWWEHFPCTIVYPALPTINNLPPAAGSANAQPIYVLTNNDATTGSQDNPGTSSSGYTPPWPSSATSAGTGQITPDNMLVWISLGPPAWVSSHEYAQWYPGAKQFSVVVDTYDVPNFQVCIATGESNTTAPELAWQPSHVYGAAAHTWVKNPSGTYTKFTTTAGGTSGTTEPSWDFTPTHTTSDNTVTWIATATTSNDVWGNVYGDQTVDGTATWVCVGNASLAWATNQQWFLPVNGFAPPTSAQPYGGASVNGGGYEETVIGTGVTGSTQPIWPGSVTPSLTLTGVANASGQTAAYAGTITGGGSNAFVGYLFNIAGFVATPANNGTNFLCTASTTSHLTLVNPNAVAETHAATASVVPVGSTVTDNTVTWYTEAAFTLNSLAWLYGFSYAYSYYARTTLDGYGYGVGLGPDNVGIGPPPGLQIVLGPPTGSETGLVTNASPVTTITGANTGAINTLTLQGSSDPQFDTIIIWRSLDGGGPGNMFQLTEIPMPARNVQGDPGTTTFQDYLPSVATTIGGVPYPGLDELVLAPIALQNSPPPTGAIEGVFWGNRVWVAVGATVYASAGPDAGNPYQVPGNGNEQFPPLNSWVFPSNVTRMVGTTDGLLIFTTSDIHIIAGGPSISTYVSRLVAAGYGLLSWNALAQNAGVIYFYAADKRLLALDMNGGFHEIGFNIADKVKASFNPATAYVVWHVNGSDDQALYIGDGATGWYRGNPNQSPDQQLTGPVWSPFATIVGGVKALASIEVTTGVHQLLLGPTGAGTIAYRDSSYTTFTDRGSAYESFITIGALVLAQPGQIAELGFITGEFLKIGTSPIVSVLVDEIDNGTPTFESLATYTFPNNAPNANLPPQDPPYLYGATLSPTTIYANRYYFDQTIGASGNPRASCCRFMFIKIDFGNTDTIQNEMLSLTVFGKHWSEI